MKKGYYMFIVIAIAVILLNSCSPKSTTDDYCGMNSKTFFDNVSLPEKLTIDFDPDAIMSIPKAKSYRVEPIIFDKQKLIDAFVKNAITDEKVWAEGPQVIAKNENIREVLNIHDGGKSYGVENGVFGFTYIKRTNGVFGEKLDTVAETTFDPDSNDMAIYGYDRNIGYASASDLSFMPYQAALDDINSALEKVGMPHYIINKTYSLDLETMQAHYQYYLNSGMADEELKNLSWTKDDESYVFSLRQIIDGIPIVNHSWFMSLGVSDTAAGNRMPAPISSLIYDKTGIRRISISNMLNIIDEIEENNLISLYQALKTLIDDYALTIIENDIHIVSAELCYLIVPGKEENSMELVPGWMFCSTRTAEYNGQEFTAYRYDVVNAATGQHYPSRW